MLKWIKKLFTAKRDQETELGEVVQVPPHFHVDRITTQNQVDIPDFTDQEKIDIDIWARENHGIKLDRRKSKNNMIDELKTKIKSKES